MDHAHRILTDRRGFSLAELVIIVVIMGLAAAIAIPQLDTESYKVNAAVRGVSTKLSSAQRLSVSLQHNVVVALDAGNNRLRIHEDANNNGTIDGAERVTSHPLEDGVTFGRGGAGAHTFGGAPINFTRTQDGMPAIIFRRDGSASEYGGFYLITAKSMAAGEDHNVRAAEIVRATGKASWYRYGASGWTRGD
ncbi:MAG: hypothetical protein HKM89_11245 [Gemmatimonadales bacterium]|nr:hypothetical protein [Gemmatimonadales bacterium]